MTVLAITIVISYFIISFLSLIKGISTTFTINIQNIIPLEHVFIFEINIILSILKDILLKIKDLLYK